MWESELRRLFIKCGDERCLCSRRTKAQVFQAMVMLVLLCGMETWPGTQKDIMSLKTFQMRCPCVIVSVTVRKAAECWHTGGDWRATNQIATETEEVAVVQTPADDARPSATKATATVHTVKKVQEARRDFSVVGACHQQRPNRMAWRGDEQKCMW